MLLFTFKKATKWKTKLASEDLASLRKANALLLHLQTPPKLELALVHLLLQISKQIGVKKQYCSKRWTECFKKYVAGGEWKWLLNQSGDF